MAIVSEPKYTPGPWRFDVFGLITQEGSDLHIAQLHNKREEDFPSREANGNLIAAAPELLNALKWSVNHAEECLGDYPELLDIAIALIAKAEGKP
jgi:hypothetical protein